MAKKRTKKQKKIAALKRKLQQAQPNQSFVTESVAIPNPKTEKSAPTPQITHKTQNLLFYDSGLIKKDLRKTIMATIIIAIILSLIYYLLVMGGRELIGF